MMTGTSRRMDLPRGFSDVEPNRMATLQRVEQRWFEQCALAGFQPVQVPAVGFTDTFVTGHHASGERIYRFPDRRGRDLALVSDSLPALLRLAGSRGLPDQRLSYACPVFRYERKPRRHFHHLGLMEVSRVPGDSASQLRSIRRLIETIAAFLRPYLAAEFTVTDPGIWHELVSQFVPPENVSSYLDRLRRTPIGDRLSMLRADGAPDAVTATVDLLADEDKPDTATRAVPAYVLTRIRNTRALVDALNRQGIQAIPNLNELHASEFHDGLACLVRHGSVLLGDGGSYSRFATDFLGTPVSAHAAVIGLERVADIAGKSDYVTSAADIAVLAFPDSRSAEHADQLTSSLREQGIAVWDSTVVMPIRRYLRNLADLNIPLSVLIGQDEVRSADFRVRDRSGEIHTVPKEELPIWLAERIGRDTARVFVGPQPGPSTPSATVRPSAGGTQSASA
ncbi:ATP phosphoribosyltransferase regulatory subunit [Nocardia sp. NBC_01009]|uniref:ATP phosphoribosyltransferase regulatory subunit n=1 Tax=Nocardia sp. NBC_01009 TaxID=2975996 RepID=UPI003868F89E|nr:ATP phosphoribosyltransferase regulatory subunit [Nocardia sp. NBC_01009]